MVVRFFCRGNSRIAIKIEQIIKIIKVQIFGDCIE